MKKLLSAVMFTVLGASIAMAVPAKQTPVTVKQSDGSEITITMRGDEWHHSFVTTDGIPVVLTDLGDVMYRTSAGVSAMMAHNPEGRSAEENTFIAANAEQMTVEAISKTGKRSAARGANVRKKTQVPTMGSPRVPILLVEYKDKKMSNTIDAFVKQYTEGTTSAYQYFVDQSNGKYTPQYDVYGIYTLDSNRSTYGGNDSDGNDKGVGLMVSEAIAKAGGEIDWSLYDNDGDGEADVCVVVYAGVGEAQASTVANAVWPCQWELSDASRYGDGTGAVTRNGVKIDKFAVFNEVGGSSDRGTKIDGVGTFCHEFSHCLGLPDFYETTYKYGYYGMGGWSLMDSGCYNNDGYTPIGYSAYEKAFMNWVELIEPTENTFYELPVWNQKSLDTDLAVKVTSNINSNEYYILEYRAKQGWDQYNPAEGVLITHFSYIKSRWDENSVNDKSVQLATVVPADNSLSANNESGDLYGTSNHELTDDSKPAAKLYLTATGSASGNAGYLGKPITEINVDKTAKVASFWFMKDVLPVVDPVISDEAQDVTEDSFTAVWTDETADEYVDSYTLSVSMKNAGGTELLLDEDMSEGTTTWTKSTNGTYAEKTGYLRLGTASALGSVTSPAVDLESSGGVLTALITAKAYGTDSNVTMRVAVKNNGTTVASKDVTITDEDDVYAVVLEGVGDGNDQVVISNTVLRKRVMLKRVQVYSGEVDVEDATAVKRKAEETGDASTRVITGITEKHYTVTGLTPGATYKYRVKTVYVDGSESTWTPVKTVSLATSAVNEIRTDAAVKSVKYVNMMGVESAEPFAGLNIVVTTHDDGSVIATKQVK